MTNKIPLEKAIAGAYRFLFSDILSILGIIWLPYLAFGGIAGFLIWHWLALHPLASLHFDKAHFAAFLPLLQVAPLIWFCSVLAALMVTIGLVRKALGLMEGPTFFFFTLGAPLWRLFAAYILVFLIYVGTVVLFAVIGAAWVLFGAKYVPAGVGYLIDVVGLVTMICWIIYMVVRLLFFLPAVVVAEETIGIGRSWDLGRGNFWRIFLIGIVVVLPVAIVGGMVNSILSSALYGPMPMPNFANNPNPDPQALLNYYGQIFSRIGPTTIAVQLLTNIATVALFAGAVANAYRGVTGVQPPAPEAPTTP